MKNTQRLFAAWMVCLSCCLGLCLDSQAATACSIVPIPKRGERLLAVISDLHFGLGRAADERWNPKEDFRWSNALKSFLDQVSICGNRAVDLVVAGDLLEMWQPPEGISCIGPSNDIGCSADEAGRVADAIIHQHKVDLEALGHFTFQGDNRLYVVPGNHDAALMLPAVWFKVAAAIRAKEGRLQLAASGAWLSPDGRVLVEHGHQIGRDVNRFVDWPKVDVIEQDGTTFLHRPWGEQFVQRLFNAQEVVYPIIDNLSPESAGARYRLADRGLWTSVADVARFIQFNLFETSSSQKVTLLGNSGTPRFPQWNISLARSKGYKLFEEALSPADPFRVAMQADDLSAKDLRARLSTLAADSQALPDAEIVSLCSLAAEQPTSVGCTNNLGASAQSLMQSRRDILTDHLNMRMSEPAFREMRMFIYAHTHELEEGWDVATKRWNVSVFNTGAFQRTINDAEFQRLAQARAEEPSQTLKSARPEDLGACYSVVIATLGAKPIGRTLRWNMEEAGTGAFVLPGDPSCTPASVLRAMKKVSNAVRPKELTRGHEQFAQTRKSSTYLFD